MIRVKIIGIVKKSVVKISRILAVNWFRTIYINFKMLPFSQAKCLPILIYGPVKFGSLNGRINFNCSVRTGLLLFGYRYEGITTSNNTEFLSIGGLINVNGLFACGPGYNISVEKTGILSVGNYSSLGRNGMLICTKSVTLGEFARIGFNSLVSDSNYHKMLDLATNTYLPMQSNICLGNYNYVGSNVAIQTKTITPDFCTIASFSLCAKDYSDYGQNILIGGYPAKLLRSNIVRDWVNEKENLAKMFDVNFL